MTLTSNQDNENLKKVHKATACIIAERKNIHKNINLLKKVPNMLFPSAILTVNLSISPSIKIPQKITMKRNHFVKISAHFKI